jgi:hypothetical protein
MSRSEFIMDKFPTTTAAATPYLPIIVLLVAIISVLLVVVGIYRVFQTIYYWINVCLQGWMRFKESEKED